MSLWCWHAAWMWRRVDVALISRTYMDRLRALRNSSRARWYKKYTFWIISIGVFSSEQERTLDPERRLLGRGHARIFGSYSVHAYIMHSSLNHVWNYVRSCDDSTLCWDVSLEGLQYNSLFVMRWNSCHNIVGHCSSHVLENFVHIQWTHNLSLGSCLLACAFWLSTATGLGIVDRRGTNVSCLVHVVSQVISAVPT